MIEAFRVISLISLIIFVISFFGWLSMSWGKTTGWNEHKNSVQLEEHNLYANGIKRPTITIQSDKDGNFRIIQTRHIKGGKLNIFKP